LESVVRDRDLIIADLQRKARGRQAHREARSRFRELVEMGGVVWEGAVVGEEGSKERGFVDEQRGNSYNNNPNLSVKLSLGHTILI
jgi:hypothetical protein